MILFSLYTEDERDFDIRMVVDSGMLVDFCASKIAAPGKRQHGFTAGHENKYLGLGICGRTGAGKVQ